MKFFTTVSKDICIAPGTDYTSVFIVGQGVVLKEASVVAYNTNTNELVAVGDEALKMEEKAPKSIKTVRPIQGGVITDSEIAGELFSGILKNLKKGNLVKPRIMVSVPCGLTDVEERAFIDACMHAGARQVVVIKSAVASALGAGCDVSIARGLMVLDIGAGKTDIAAISMCNTVTENRIKIAGNSFSDTVKDIMKKKHSIEIGNKTAKMIKENLESRYIEVSGIDTLTHMPRKITVNPADFIGAFDEDIDAIAVMIKETLDNVPPEILGDIMEDGILLVGGGAKLGTLAEKLSRKCGNKLFPAEDIDLCNIRGTGLAMEHLDTIPNIAQSYHNI